jgi:hypothetical protein
LTHPQTGKVDYNHERLFQFELARKLGMTHRQLMQEMTDGELLEWQAYAKTRGVMWNLKTGKGKKGNTVDVW